LPFFQAKLNWYNLLIVAYVRDTDNNEQNKQNDNQSKAGVSVSAIVAHKFYLPSFHESAGNPLASNSKI